VVVHESGCISALTFFLLANLAKLPAGMKDPSVHQTKDPDKHAQKRTPNTGLIFCRTKPVLATFFESIL
jgi:hypothetical protein